MTEFLTHISKSLGRTVAPARVPAPPSIDPAISRFVTPADNLKQVFITHATLAKLHVIECTINGLADAVVAQLQKACSKSVVVTRCAEFEQVNMLGRLNEQGITARFWDEMTLDESYEVDAGLTDVWLAIAETGSLVVRASGSHGRAASLVPPLHVAMVRTSQIVPDLMDAMNACGSDGTGSGVVIITGPSKTADIEMNLVVGVHGPGEVVVLLIDDNSGAS